MVIAGLLGIVSMRMSERLGPGENADDLAADVIDVTLAGLRSGVPLRSSNVAPCAADAPLSEVQAAQALRPAVVES
jgi:hypothetical protein